MDNNSLVKVACVQCCSHDNLENNLNNVASLVSEAARQGAKCVIIPETFFGIAQANMVKRCKEPFEHGPLQDFCAELARQHQIYLVGGTIPLIGRNTQKATASCLVFGPTGERLARYDKIHLFDVVLDNGEHITESLNFEPGHIPVVVDTPWAKLGLSICYDVRFPELYSALRNLGAEWLSIPSAFTAITGKRHWEILVRARAVETQCYVFAANQCGEHYPSRSSFGDSMIVDPQGEICVRLKDNEGVIIADIDRALLQSVRRNMPIWDHKRL